METKSGISTSEFWVTMAAMLAGLIVKVTGWDINAEEFGMIWGPAFAYIGSRGLAKLGVKMQTKK